MNEEYCREAASRGGQFLDGLVSLWFVDVDLETLNLGSCTDCVLGQLARRADSRASYRTVVPMPFNGIDLYFGDREVVLAKLGLEQPISPGEAADLGFVLSGQPHTSPVYQVLTEAWRGEIESRRARYLAE